MGSKHASNYLTNLRSHNRQILRNSPLMKILKDALHNGIKLMGEGFILLTRGYGHVKKCTFAYDMNLKHYR